MKFIDVKEYKRAKAGGIYKTVIVSQHQKILPELHSCPKCKTKTMHSIKFEFGEKESRYVWYCKTCHYPSHSVLPANIDWEIEDK